MAIFSQAQPSTMNYLDSEEAIKSFSSILNEQLFITIQHAENDSRQAEESS